jgi:hypothetical protein
MTLSESELLAKRLSRPASFVVMLLVLQFFLWLLSIPFQLFVWFGGLVNFFAMSFAVSVILQIFLISFFHYIAKGVRNGAKLALVLNIVLISFLYLACAIIAGYAGAQLPSVYSAQLAIGANKAWLLALIILVSALALSFVGFILRRWYLHAAATLTLFKANA